MYQKLYRFFPILMLCPLLATAELRDGLEACAGLENDASRLVCYDKLASSAVEKQISDPRPITAEVGKDREQEKERQERVYTVVVSECKASGTSRRMYFYLDNGQVWRQQNDKWMSARNCESSGTITRDFFGYQLYLEKTDQSIRVSRIR